MFRTLSFDVGTKNLALCDLSVDSAGDFTVFDWSVGTCVADDVNVNKTPIHDLAPAFSKTVRASAKQWLFNDDGSVKPIDRVFIENQPMGGRGAARNLKTKILSHILQCVLLELRPDVPVSFVHPGLKLKDMPRPDGRTTYRQNKLYAIAKTLEIVQGQQCKSPDVCKTVFVDAKKKTKKDDLADAFLQGLLAGQMYAKGDVIEPETERSDKKEAEPKKKTKKVAAPKVVAPKAPKVAAPKASVAPEVEAPEVEAPKVATPEEAPKVKEVKPKAPKRKISEVVSSEAINVDTVESKPEKKRGRPINK